MKKFLANYQQVVGRLNIVVFMLLVMSLAFPWHFTQPLFTIWLIAWFIEGRWACKKNWRFGKSTIPVLILFGFVVWEALSLFWTQDLSAGKNELARHAPIFALLLFTLFGGNEQYKAYRIKAALMVGSLMAVISYGVVIYWFAHMDKLQGFDNYSPWTIFGEGPIQYIKHRLYLCLVLLLAVCYSGDVYGYLLTRYSKPFSIAMITIADAILLTAILLTGSRSTAIILPILGLVYLIQKIHGKFRWIVIAGFVAILVAGSILAPKYNWRFQIMRDDIKNVLTHQVEITGVNEPRLYLWSIVFRHADEYGVVGMGAGSSDEFMLKCYEEDHYHATYDTHNNYLYAWMDYGYIGLIYLLLTVVILPFFHTGRARKDTAVACAFFGWSMLTENLLTMMSGLYIIYVLIVLIQTEQQEDSQLPACP